MKNFKIIMKKKLPYILHIVATFFAIGLCAWWITEINAKKFKSVEPFVMMLPIGISTLSVPITLIFGFIALFKKEES
ncbi:MAG: hypothetical protein IJ506_03105 [Clostridia bacterium]|nr:hypothetical protein [Clostridia bacterium]